MIHYDTSMVIVPNEWWLTLDLRQFCQVVSLITQMYIRRFVNYSMIKEHFQHSSIIRTVRLSELHHHHSANCQRFVFRIMQPCGDIIKKMMKGMMKSESYNTTRQLRILLDIFHSKEFFSLANYLCFSTINNQLSFSPKYPPKLV